MACKRKVIILCGGKSAEHEVSLQSAKNVYEAADKDKYDVETVRIDKGGVWEKAVVDLCRALDAGEPPVIFPVLHGTFGEDGTVQGLLKLAGVPFVGASVLGSAVGMDKDVQKRLLRDAGIPVVKFVVLRRDNMGSSQDQWSCDDKRIVSYDDLKSALASPFFVKPANLGSSVGVHKVRNSEEFKRAIDDAFLYDVKVLVEEYIPGREIECSVLGNDEPIASVPGEIIPRHEFYSYGAKYIDEGGALLEIPAKLPEETAREAQDMAAKAFKVLCCEGMARVDFFLRNDGSTSLATGGELFLNEINTIPGFTKISMYPKLWGASGISYAELIDWLIGLALERHERERGLKTAYEKTERENPKF